MENKVDGHDGRDHNGNGSAEDVWAARFLALEAKVIAMDMLLAAMIVVDDKRTVALDRLKRDVVDWANRATHSAQTPLARKRARRRSGC